MRDLSKKASNILYVNIAYLLFVVVLFGLLFVFVSRTGSSVSSSEKVYAKKLAMILDSVNPGSSITMDVSDMALIAISEKFKPEEMISFSPQQVTVKLTAKGGYSQRFFTLSREISSKIEQQGGRYLLKLEVKRWMN